MIPYGKQSISNLDIASVVKVLKSDYLTQGPIVAKFEQSFSETVQSKYSISANSATSALHVTCLGLGISKESIVWTSPNSFVASSNCALYCGAKIDFVDIDQQSGNISIPALKLKLEQAKKKNTLPSLLIPVHFSGYSADMEAIKKLSIIYKFKIIEDASHAVGGKYRNKPIGSCQYSDAAIFSFHPVKIITTGEGGMVTTNNKVLANKIKRLITHGIEKNKRNFINNSNKNFDWYYEQQELGFNYRMTDISAALGISQLKRLPKFINKRKAIALKYEKYLDNPMIDKPNPDSFDESSLHLYVIRCKDNDFRERLFYFLRNEGFFVQLHYFPIHLQPYYRNLGFKQNMFPEAESFASKAISLPIFYDLKSSHLAQLIGKINKFR